MQSPGLWLGPLAWVSRERACSRGVSDASLLHAWGEGEAEGPASRSWLALAQYFVQGDAGGYRGVE